jgi:hypothetical protein
MQFVGGVVCKSEHQGFKKARDGTVQAWGQKTLREIMPRNS